MSCINKNSQIEFVLFYSIKVSIFGSSWETTDPWVGKLERLKKPSWGLHTHKWSSHFTTSNGCISVKFASIGLRFAAFRFFMQFSIGISQKLIFCPINSKGWFLTPRHFFSSDRIFLTYKSDMDNCKNRFVKDSLNLKCDFCFSKSKKLSE